MEGLAWSDREIFCGPAVNCNQWHVWLCVLRYQSPFQDRNLLGLEVVSNILEVSGSVQMDVFGDSGVLAL